MLQFPLMPQLLYASFIECEKDEQFYWSAHAHDQFTQFLLIEDGSGTFIIDNRCYTAKAHMLLRYSSGLYHEECALPGHPFRAYSLSGSHFAVDGLPPLFMLAREQPQMLALGAHFFKFERFSREMIAEMQKGLQECANHWFALFLIELARFIDTPTIHKQHISSAVTAAQNFMKLHLGESITLKNISHHVALSPNYLCKLFQHEIGESPLQYLIRQRMLEAERYIRETDLSLAQIADLCGYQSITHFTQKFRQFSGLAPGRYRQETRSSSTDHWSANS